MQFSSRPPFNDDPQPLVHPSGKRTPAFSYHFEYEPGESGAFGAIAPARVAPRPEFDRPQINPTNPILAEFRSKVDGNHPYWSDIWDSTMDWLDHAEAWDYYCSSHGITAAHIDHARQVLTRLPLFQKEF